ncbi:MAG TPA: hypothetical protein VGC62_19790 [Pseudomonas sp.]|uniref:hypothetical protein n=1 Tax=Pseudomonas sp. TaxID=306 RepID=UPI002ED7F583
MSDNHANNINAGDSSADMAFLQYALPPLKSGNFTVTVTQQVSVSGTVVDTFQASQAFYVAGERYSLGATDVNSVFPPMGNQGEFSNNLAHVVFNTPTLPWQRSPNPTDTAPVAGQPVATWLGVLLFDQNDPPPKPKTVTLADLSQPPAGIFFPQRMVEDGEDSTDPVRVIDIPIALFNAIAPSLADLNWTAHVRAVDPTAKAGDTVPAVDYSMVFGNRLPVPGNIATAHLVSFEDFGLYLPADDGSPNTAIPDTTAAVRVVTLQNWTFSALDLKQTFAGLLTQVSLDPPALQLPYNSANATGDAAADSAVQNAFGMGYTAMNHELRDGSSTVSWYRGPLLPLTAPVTSSPPWADADQLQRYDPTKGMFDVSYSSAWQLGRLLTLHDGAFAAALYRWKLTQTQAQVAALEQQVIDQELPPIASSDTASGGADTSSTANLRHARIRAVIKGLAGPAATILRATGTKE